MQSFLSQENLGKKRNFSALKENFQKSCLIENFDLARWKVGTMAEENVFDFPILSLENWYYLSC